MIALTATVFEQEPLYFADACAKGPIEGEVYHNIPNQGLVYAYQVLYHKHSDQDVLIYLHDDTELLEDNWVARVAREFTDPQVAIVGLGGATGIGVDDIYKRPYRLDQLIRRDYWSNQKGWEIHGRRERGARDVAVVDGFFIAVRADLLKAIGGFSWMKCEFHTYDTALCLMAHRRGYKVRIVGIETDHHGGGTSTKPEYIEWLRERGKTVADDHALPHIWLYNEFRNEMPLKV